MMKSYFGIAWGVFIGIIIGGSLFLGWRYVQQYLPEKENVEEASFGQLLSDLSEDGSEQELSTDLFKELGREEETLEYVLYAKDTSNDDVDSYEQVYLLMAGQAESISLELDGNYDSSIPPQYDGSLLYFFIKSDNKEYPELASQAISETEAGVMISNTEIGFPSGLRLSPDSDYLAYLWVPTGKFDDLKGLWVFNLADGAAQKLTDEFDRANTIADIWWSEDEETVYYPREQEGVNVLYAKGIGFGGVSEAFSIDWSGLDWGTAPFTISGNEESIVYWQGETQKTQINLIDLGDGAESELVSTEGKITELLWSEDGEWLTFVTLPARKADPMVIRSYRLLSKTEADIYVAEGGDVLIRDLHYAPGGKRIAFVAENLADASSRVLEIDFDSGQIKTISEEEDKNEVLRLIDYRQVPTQPPSSTDQSGPRSLSFFQTQVVSNILENLEEYIGQGHNASVTSFSFADEGYVYIDIATGGINERALLQCAEVDEGIACDVKARFVYKEDSLKLISGDDKAAGLPLETVRYEADTQAWKFAE